MKLNNKQNARKLVKQIAIKHGISLNEISRRINTAEGGVNKILHPSRHLRPETLVQIIQTINPNYRVSIDFISHENYKVVVKNYQGVIEFGYSIDLRFRESDISTAAGRLKLYKEMLLDWSQPYVENSATAVGFCEYLSTFFGIVTHGKGVFEKVLPELWKFRLEEKLYYWPGKGVDPEARAIRVEALKRTIELMNKNN